MLDPHTEHATQLRNHWYWRPGHRPGRPYYTWHLTFEHQPELHRLVTDYQRALRDVPGLDPVPLKWLHITMQGIGFADRVSDADRDAIIQAARYRLAEIPSPVLTFQHASIRSEAIALYPYNLESIQAIRTHIRQAIADAWGADKVPEPSAGYEPHLSVAYVNNDAEPSIALNALSAFRTESVQLTPAAVSCIALQRVNHAYHWTTHGTVPLARR